MGTLRALIDQASGYAEALYDPDDCLMPHFLAEAADGGITVMALAMGGADLDRMRKLAEMKFALDGYRRWVFFGEAWMVEYHGGGRGPQPFEHPERIEIIEFDAFDVAGQRRRRAHRQILKLDGAPPRIMPLVFTELKVVDLPSVAVQTGA